MQHDNFDEEDSLQRIEQGDEVAARELLRHFHPFVLKLVRAHLPRRISEEDLVQMIFIKVFHKLNQYTGRVPLEHWISRIAVNTCLNALKAEKIRPEWRLGDFSEEIAAGIEKSDRVELLVRTQMSGQRDLLQAAGEIARGVLSQIVNGGCRDQKAIQRGALGIGHGEADR